jgi:hypothetical protein
MLSNVVEANPPPPPRVTREAGRRRALLTTDEHAGHSPVRLQLPFTEHLREM